MIKEFDCPICDYSCPYCNAFGRCLMTDEGYNPIDECDVAMAYYEEEAE